MSHLICKLPSHAFWAWSPKEYGGEARVVALNGSKITKFECSVRDEK